MLNRTIQTSLDSSDYAGLYDILIEKENFWRQLNESIDFSFIQNEIEQNYSPTMGRPAEDPIKMFKLILLKTAYKLSDRDLIKQLRTDMQMKYFLGYAPEETKLIDPSLLSKFRHMRLKDLNLLDMMLEKTVQLALEKKLSKLKIN